MEQTGNRNFNQGDKVVCIKKDYYSNPYHNGFGNSNQFIKTARVSGVYEYGPSNWRGKVFYLYGHQHQVDSIGDSASYQYNEYCDKDGIKTEWPRNEDEVWMNYTKNPDGVKQKIKEIKEEFHNYCEDLRQKEIKELENRIKFAQARIEKLKEGDTFKYLEVVRSEKEWNEKMDKVIDKVLSY